SPRSLGSPDSFAGEGQTRRSAVTVEDDPGDDLYSEGRPHPEQTCAHDQEAETALVMKRVRPRNCLWLEEIHGWRNEPGRRSVPPARTGLCRRLCTNPGVSDPVGRARAQP